MGFDQRSILFALEFVVLSMVLIVAIEYFADSGKTPGMRSWISGYSLYSLSLLVIVLRGPIPATISIVVGNGLSFVGLVLTAIGTYRFSGKRPPWIVASSLSLAGFAAAVIFSVAIPNLTARILVFSLIVAALDALIAIPLFEKKRTTSGGKLLGSLYAAAAVTSLVRMSVSLGIDPKTPWFGPLRPESTLFIVLALLLIMTAPAYLLMIKVGLENALKAKAEENELLFREMNHRTKNNLAIATSLISMQRDASPSELAPTLDSLEARMGSIALIHELLYKGGIDAMRESSARRYLEDLLGMIERTTPQGRFSFDLQVDDILVDSKRMLLLGLAADEAIVNSIKHAYPDGRRGPIRVRFSALAETPNVLELVVEDDGIGRVSQSSEKGLGITILATLASQLGGSTRFGAASSGGAKFTLTMPR